MNTAVDVQHDEKIRGPTLIRQGTYVITSLRRAIAGFLVVAAALLGGASGQAQTLGPSPDPNDSIWFSAQPPTPDECYRFGVRYWIKKNLVDKRAACACVKCGWTTHLPPHRLCWRTC